MMEDFPLVYSKQAIAFNFTLIFFSVNVNRASERIWRRLPDDTDLPNRATLSLVEVRPRHDSGLQVGEDCKLGTKLGIVYKPRSLSIIHSDKQGNEC